ncbi:addiction module protein [Desulfobacterales bacterium HSG17]|nr:addiction module protein [Desulfobacterales bacterium HSG17]
MIFETNQILKKALSLPSFERAGLIDHLLSSLDMPDEKIDSFLRKEVEYRVEAYKKGNLKSVSLEQVLAKYQR